GQAFTMRAELHRVGPRLDYGDDRRIADALAQAIQGGGDGGRMVGEVIVDRHAVDLGNFLHAPLDAAEFAQRLGTLLRQYADVACCRQGCQGIGNVVPAGQFPVDDTLYLPLEDDLETRAVLAEQPGLP